MIYDSDLDFLEVLFEKKEVYFHLTGDDGLTVRYDKEGNAVGFVIEGLTLTKDRRLDTELVPKQAEAAHDRSIVFSLEEKHHAQPR